MFGHTENRHKKRFRHNFSLSEAIGGFLAVAIGVACFFLRMGCDSKTAPKTPSERQAEPVDKPAPPPPPKSERQAEPVEQSVESAKDHAEELAPQSVARDIHRIPTNEWTDAEKQDNQRLFLEKYRSELESAITEIKRQIDHYTQAKIKYEKIVRIEQRKVANANDFIKKAKQAAKAKKFPVEIDGQTLSQQELESLFLRYQQLAKERGRVTKEYGELKKVAEVQLHKLNKELPKKLAMLDKCRVYLKRLEAHKNIGYINDVIARIEDSSISAEVISDSFSDTFAREEKKVETIKTEEREALKSLYED